MDYRWPHDGRLHGHVCGNRLGGEGWAGEGAGGSDGNYGGGGGFGAAFGVIWEENQEGAGEDELRYGKWLLDHATYLFGLLWSVLRMWDRATPELVEIPSGCGESCGIAWVRREETWRG